MRVRGAYCIAIGMSFSMGIFSKSLALPVNRIASWEITSVSNTSTR